MPRSAIIGSQRKPVSPVWARHRRARPRHLPHRHASGDGEAVLAEIEGGLQPWSWRISVGVSISPQRSRI